MLQQLGELRAEEIINRVTLPGLEGFLNHLISEVMKTSGYQNRDSAFGLARRTLCCGVKSLRSTASQASAICKPNKILPKRLGKRFDVLSFAAVGKFAVRPDLLAVSQGFLGADELKQHLLDTLVSREFGEC